MLLFLNLAACLVAYANGANDNFKGVATLYGSGTASYRGAIVWATVTTVAGALTAAIISGKLVASFSGRRIVPDALTHAPLFLTAVGLGAAATTLIATRFGLPVSTTHALLGGLLGAGLVATHGHLSSVALGKSFVLPLLLSPIIAMAGSRVAYPFLRLVRLRLGVEREMCLCVDLTPQPVAISSEGTAVCYHGGVALAVKQASECRTRYVGTVMGIDAQRVLDRVHYLSAGAVGFARGMNDAPKIVALLVASRLIGLSLGLAVVATLMALGGLLSARRVAETMSRRITDMNHGQAFTANAVTASLVLAASLWGLPVSTTHVSVGALAGIGAATGHARCKTLAAIVGAWVTTLPLAAGLAAAAYAFARFW